METLKRNIQKFDSYAMTAGTDFTVMIVGNENKSELVAYDKIKDDLKSEKIKFFGSSGLFNWWDNKEVLTRKFNEAIEWYNREDVINTHQIPWKTLDSEKYYVWFDGVAYRGIKLYELKINREGGQVAYFLKDKVEALKLINREMIKTIQNIGFDMHKFLQDAERLEKQAEKLKEQARDYKTTCNSCGSSVNSSRGTQAYLNEASNKLRDAEDCRKNYEFLKAFKEKCIDL